MKRRKQRRRLRSWWTDHTGRRWRMPNSRERLRPHFIKGHEALRDFIFHRDGYRCRRCQVRYAPFVLDHIRTVKSGGSHRPENLQTLCKRCHDRKTYHEDSGREKQHAPLVQAEVSPDAN